MSERYIFVDTDVINNLANIGVGVGAGFPVLDSLYRSGATIVLTSTVRAEATTNRLLKFTCAVPV